MPIKFRELKADEIDVRVAQCNDKGVSLLLYKDARCDMRILDETVGVENWQNKFYENKGILFCSLGINTNYYNTNLGDRWIWKDDAGTESNQEAEKGNASDARKRSGFAWGIGRSLYTAPQIFVSFENGDAKKIMKNNKPTTKDKFVVEKIAYDDEKIVGLAIINKSLKKRVFVWQSK